MIGKRFLTNEVQIWNRSTRNCFVAKVPKKVCWGKSLPGDDEVVIKKKVAQLTKTTNKYMKRIGEALEFDIKLTTYVTRHSVMTILSNKGADIKFLGEKIGHSSKESTEKYINSLDNGQTEKWQTMLKDIYNY